MKAQWEALNTGWHDKTADSFDRQYWSEICSTMNATLPDIRERLQELDRLVHGAIQLDIK